jgi:hypothetical protein
MTWMSLRLLVWWPRGSSLTRVPGPGSAVPWRSTTKHDVIWQSPTASF